MLNGTWPSATFGQRLEDLQDLHPDTLLLGNRCGRIPTPGYLGSDVAQRMPNVIQHAMGFTRALGEVYLWVDRLAHIPSDPDSPAAVSGASAAKRGGVYLNFSFRTTRFSNECSANLFRSNVVVIQYTRSLGPEYYASFPGAGPLAFPTTGAPFDFGGMVTCSMIHVLPPLEDFGIVV
jgi:hypothetical protein